MVYTPRILIVDDEPHICRSLQTLLEREGYAIHTGGSGSAARDLLATQAFDLLLLDMGLPDCDGLDIIGHVVSRGLELHIIVITGNASIDSAVTALRQGAYDYLKKPFAYDELLKRVSNALRQSQLAREKQHINARLAQTEERYQVLVQHSPDIIYTLDADGRFVFVNQTAERLLGYAPETLRGRRLDEIVHPGSHPVLGRLRAEHGAVELRLLPAQQHDAWKTFLVTHISLAAMEGPESGGACVYGTARDITYRKALEEQVAQTHKMEALGSLAGGIAHDFNNILMGIMGHTSLLRRQIPQHDERHHKLLSIEQHTRSGAGLARQLLSFASGRAPEVRPLAIGEVVRRTLDMFRRTRRELQVQIGCPDDTWGVQANEAQMEQVLMNFFVNAWQAMPAGGTLAVEIANQADAAPPDLSPGRYVEVTIRDTGCGMDETVRRRIFEPFFSTKGAGGTGLGLASAYRIVTGHGGTITVQSAPGAGTVFRLYLPACDLPAAAALAPVCDPLPGTETILLVDDEEEMVNLGTEILEELGYRTLRAAGGDEALRVFERHRADIDLVVVDLIMPGMSGTDLCARIRQLDPAARLLVASGYSRDSAAAAGLAGSCDGFIQKPFTITDLSQALRTIFDRAAAS